MTARLVKGISLTPTQRAEILRAFIYRNTVETPDHTHAGIVPAPTMTDSQFIESHAFYIRNDGHLADIPQHCEPAFLAD